MVQTDIRIRTFASRSFGHSGKVICVCFPLLPKCGYKAFWCVLSYFTDAAFPSMLDVIIRMLFWAAKQTTPQISTPLWDNKGLPIDRRPDPNAGIPLECGQKSYSAQAGFTSLKVCAAYFPNINRQKSGNLEIWFCCCMSLVRGTTDTFSVVCTYWDESNYSSFPNWITPNRR